MSTGVEPPADRVAEDAHAADALRDRGEDVTIEESDYGTLLASIEGTGYTVAVFCEPDYLADGELHEALASTWLAIADAHGGDWA